MTNKPATLPQWVIKRAGGRRRYNSARQRAAIARMNQVWALWMKGLHQAAIARWLGVHRSTITRDMQTLEYMWSSGKKGKRHTRARRITIRFQG